MIAFAKIILPLIADAFALAALVLRPGLTVSAENLVRRRQLALFKERGVKHRRIESAGRFSLAALSRLCD